jgi:hypothetical protein
MPATFDIRKMPRILQASAETKSRSMELTATTAELIARSRKRISDSRKRIARADEILVKLN